MSNTDKFYRRLTQEEVDQIMVELLANELMVDDIAAEFGVSRSHIYNINSGKNFKIDGFKYPIREMVSKPRSLPRDFLIVPLEASSVTEYRLAVDVNNCQPLY